MPGRDELVVQTKLDKLARITVWGVVQGVGFRPFVYRLAREHNLKGFVRNTSGSVEIELEGDETALNNFLSKLQTDAPPMARIERVETSCQAAKGYTGFQIIDSLVQEEEYQLVSPDIATCVDCQREIFTPADRRYQYPFTNCTNCGPRFTIIEDIPYDRPRTTMREFKMCPQCQQEYDNPLDRRFHAQPNACPVCGPRLELLASDGNTTQCEDILDKASQLLRDGRILAIRGLGGFQLVCDATNKNPVDLLRLRKRRPAKPFAVMLATPDDVRKHCLVSDAEQRMLTSPEAPIVLLRWREDSNICQTVAPNSKYMGAMLPYTPLHHLLMKKTGFPLVMTSGNLSEEPISKDNDEALSRLKGIADYFLVHNREIYARYDDSVCMVAGNQPQVIRRSRGYAPYPIFLLFKAKQVLACGAELKNTFCLTKENHAFLSQHIGDLENEETLQHYVNTIDLYTRLFRAEPEVVACDLHPDYLATKYAGKYAAEHNLKLVQVQHHYAHIVSCLADNKVTGPVIGVALDGTGYGNDGTVWGGEFLVADMKGYKRAGHLEYVPLLGGDMAVRKPYRMALSYLYTLLGADFDLSGLSLCKINITETNLLKQQLSKGINSPPTSSMGRLFDAVAALLGIQHEVSYEAQAAVEMEMLATDSETPGIYPFSIDRENGTYIVKLRQLFTAIVEDIRCIVATPEIVYKFHNTVAQMTVEMCRLIALDSGLKQVALSGGVFQNRLLLQLTTDALKAAGFKVFVHYQVPCNDGGIALGQAVVAGQ